MATLYNFSGYVLSGSSTFALATSITAPANTAYSGFVVISGGGSLSGGNAIQVGSQFGGSTWFFTILAGGSVNVIGGAINSASYAVYTVADINEL